MTPPPQASTGAARPDPRRTRRRIALRVALAAVVLLAVLASPLACTTRIIPPAHLRDPVRVYVIDQGHTASLVLPDESGQLARFTYGDWNYYALRNTGLLDGIAALLWPTRGTLGRQPLSGAATPADVRAQVPADSIHILEVERQRAVELRRQLEAIQQQYLHTRVLNTDWGLRFTHHPRRYTYFGNSNHAVARWLRELGCEVRGPAFISRWRVEPPARGAGGDRVQQPIGRTIFSPPRWRDGDVPPWLKIGFTAFVLLLIPVYWRQYGPANFLWFSDIALFATAVALWNENRLLPSMMLLAVGLPELTWNVDFFFRLFTGRSLIGLANYMFDGSIPLLVRGLSLFHIFMPVIVIWLVWRLGYDRRALVLQTLLAVIVLPLSYLVSTPQDNINWVYGFGEQPQQWVHPWIYLAGLMAFFPLVVYLPTHLLVTRLLHW